MIHDLKCWPEYFDAIASGVKPFEFRVNDRDYKVGDILHLRRYDSDTMQYTGEEIDKTVTYILATRQFAKCGDGANFVIMGLAPRPDWTPCAEGLPEVGKDVIISYDANGIYNTSVGFMGRSKTWYLADEEQSQINVIAWQPLPEPYNPDRKEEAK